VKHLVTCLMIIFIIPSGTACTTAIFSGKATKDGRPLLWKNRDTSSINNQVLVFNDGRFRYFGIVNGGDLSGLNIWSGVNEVGFAIMNSASYNIELKDLPKDGEGRFMKLALQTCQTIEDFENLLTKSRFFRDVNANFGVTDAHGGAAFFEANGESYQKFDANDPKIAPHGYLVRTNFSDMGPKEGGYGFIRRERAETLISKRVSSTKMDVESLIIEITKDLTNPRTGISPETQMGETGHYLDASDTINRYSTVSCTVIHGVAEGQNINNTVFWVLLGQPICGLATPLFLSTFQVPELLTGTETAPMCDLSLKLRGLIFPFRKGHGSLSHYLDVNVLTGHGEMPNISLHVNLKQKDIFKKTNEFLKDQKEPTEYSRFQNDCIKEAYDALHQIATLVPKPI